MFVRTRVRKLKDSSSKYAYLVDNQWNSVRRKHEQKIIACLGSVADLPARGMIEKMIVALDTFATKQGFASLSDGIVLSNLSREDLLASSSEWGSLLLARHVMGSLSLDTIIRRCADADKKKQVDTDTALSVTAALLAKRLYPRSDASERSTHAWYTRDVFLTEKTDLMLMDFYRTLDVLIANKDEIEREYYERNKTLFNGKLDLVLFDTTSIYYWGAQEDTGEKDLLRYGHSKDGKGDLKQLIVGVLMTSDGVPIAHEVFPGNMADVKAFSQMMTVIKEKYRVEKVVLIADRGMVSEENIVHLEQSGFGYIVGIRMRQLPQPLKKKLLLPLDDEVKKYETEYMDKSADNLYVSEFPVSKFSEEEITQLFLKKILKGKTATFDESAIRASVKQRRFFVCLNPFMKTIAGKKRKYFTEIIRKKIASTPTKEWIVKNGYKKYLKFEKGLSPTIDYERLSDEEIYDGKWIIMTNEKSVSSYTAGTYYKTLQTIERGFRDLKSLITVQPIFHFKEERMKAHIFVCFLSLILKWYICRTLNAYRQTDGRRFIEAMTELKAIAVDRSIPVYVRTAISQETQEAMGKLKMKVPGKIILDKRSKPTSIAHSPGRPRKDRSQGQLQLQED